MVKKENKKSIKRFGKLKEKFFNSFKEMNSWFEWIEKENIEIEIYGIKSCVQYGYYKVLYWVIKEAKNAKS